MENIFWLKELDKNKINIAGTKGAYLADLYNKSNRDFSVANGFVISVGAFKEFMQSNSLDADVKKILKNLKPGNFEDVADASERIKKIINKEKISSVLESEILEAYENLNVNEELLKVSNNVLNLIKKGRSNAAVAVRSSSVFDIPGSCDNFLGISGSKNLINAIKECWSSLYSVGNIFNMKKNNADNSIAIIVQKMSDVNKSGVVLSSNPMNRENEMVIEAGFGLGQLITKGEVTPDLYLLDGNLKVKEEVVGKKKLKLIKDVNNNEIVRKKLIEEQNKKVLQGWELEDLATLTKKIERHYGKPVIVEFGFGKKLEIFHVRLFDLPEILDKDNLNGEVLVQGRGGSPKINFGVVSIDSGIFVDDYADYKLAGMLDKIKGVVVNEGALGSCFGVLCRQHGIPFVVAENSTALLSRGLIVTVDGVNGRVYKGEVKAREEKIEIADGTDDIVDVGDTYGFGVLDL